VIDTNVPDNDSYVVHGDITSYGQNRILSGKIQPHRLITSSVSGLTIYLYTITYFI
jgi:hypothetical protein